MLVWKHFKTGLDDTIVHKNVINIKQVLRFISQLQVWLFFGSTFAVARQVLRVPPRLTDSQLFFETENSQRSVFDNREDSNIKGKTEYPLTNQQSTYQPQVRALPRISHSKTAGKSSLKVLPIQTVRNYNKVNDDGSFTFGYEAADGSFKEETRGTDCVVRGKYGYIDPDGNRREFTYVSGNPCDPNALNKEIDDDVESFSEEQKNEDKDFDGQPNYPKTYPLRPIKPIHSKKSTIVTSPTMVQREYSELLNRGVSEEDFQVNHELPSALSVKPLNYHNKIGQNVQNLPARIELLHSTTPSPRVPSSTEDNEPTTINQLVTASPKYYGFTSPSSTRYLQQNTTPFYQKLRSATLRSQSEPTTATVDITPRPLIARVTPQFSSSGSISDNNHVNNSSISSSTENSGIIHAKQYKPASAKPLTSSLTRNVQLNFAAELEKYLNMVPATKNPLPGAMKLQSIKSPESVYQSELVFDLSNGQYKPQLYRGVLPTLSDFHARHKLQPYLAQQVINQPPSTIELRQPYVSLTKHLIDSRQSQPQEKIYQQQQTEQLVQSQQLFNQQQRHQKHQSQSPDLSKYQIVASQEVPQSYYYAVTRPSISMTAPASSLSLKHIDRFLQGRTSSFQ